MSRGALEAIAVDGYRNQALSRGQLSRLRGLDYWETEAFLRKRQACLPYDEADLGCDRGALKTLTEGNQE